MNMVVDLVMRWGRSDQSLAVLGKGLREKQEGEGFYNVTHCDRHFKACVNVYFWRFPSNILVLK